MRAVIEALRPRQARRRRPLSRLLRSTRGVSAVEFALLAPVLVLGCLGMVDGGMAVYERMMISQVLRAGAQPALDGSNDSVVRAVLEQTATGHFTVADGEATGDELGLDVQSHCACPGDTLVGVGCGTVCDSGSLALRLYRLSASKTFQGVLLPDWTLSGSLEVMQQ